MARCPKREPHVSFFRSGIQPGALTVIVGRYVIGETFASGGMGTVDLGRILGAGGFSRIVAVKRLYPWLAGDAEFRQMLLDEARCVSRIRHPNVVPTLDVVEADKDLYVVMEYVHGVSLAHLLKHCHDAAIPVSIAAGIVEGVLSGLHAAHEARGPRTAVRSAWCIATSRRRTSWSAPTASRACIDFGIAKAATRLQVTDPGVIKGKIGYMAPEQLLREPVTRHADVYSCGVVLWEALANRRLSDAREGEPLPRRIKQSEEVPPSRFSEGVSGDLDRVVLRALALEPKSRFPTADAMATALRGACSPASAAQVARWLHDVVGDDLEISDERVRLVELAGAESSQDMPSPHVIPERREGGVTPTAVEPTAGGVWAWRIVKVAGAALVAAAAAVALRSAWHAPGPAAGTPSPPPSLAETTLPAASTGAPASPAPAAPSPSPAPSVSSPSPPAAAARAPAAHTSRPPSRAHCDPPYTVDASGRKHYDPSCF